MKFKLDIYPLTYIDADLLPIHIRWYHNPDRNSDERIFDV